MRILGLDVGEKRIGVAKADSNTRIAVPVGYIDVDGSEWQKIAHLANIQGTQFFVIGLPRSNDGNETQQSLYARNFAKALLRRMPEAKVRMQDESLTSVLAEERLKQRGKPYEKGDIDAEAATIILQDFLESLGQNRVVSKPVDNTGDNLGNNAGYKNLIGNVENKPENNNLVAKKGDDLKIKTKKTKHRAMKWISGCLGLVALVLIVTGAVLLWQREERRREYAEWAAAEEAKQAETFTFTIRPGETIYDIKKNLIAAGYTEAEVNEALAAEYDFDFLQGRPEGASLEGYLFGETHEFYATATATEVIQKFLEGTEQVIRENNLTEQFAAQGLTLNEGFILASVVQKEAVVSDMPTVAQVFLSRLKYGIPLGSDVTVSYALDAIDPDREAYTDNSSALQVDSCYNTRLYAGLPCGAISNPGLSALLAVANPTDTNYLYFLTGDDGKMYYSYTEAEHIQNAALYCLELCKVSL